MIGAGRESKRRRFLVGALAAFASRVAAAGRLRTHAPGGREAIGVLVHSIGEVESAVALGHRALAGGADSSLATQIDTLAASLAAHATNADPRATFDALCARELATDQVTELDGWRFAESEVRLCVIVALKRDG